MSTFATIPQAIEELRKGNMLIVVDSPNRENQADIIFPAELVTEEKITFLMNVCKGFICVPLTMKKAAQLDLPLMVSKQNNTETTGVNFTITVDAKNVTDFGISAADRCKTIRYLADDNTKPSDLVRPGHMFPLLAAENGLKERQGHTEATVTMCELAGFSSCGVLCEILNNDGTVAQPADLQKFAETYRIKMISITDLVTYVQKNKKSILEITQTVIKKASSTLPTQYGQFTLTVYTSFIDNREHVVLTMGDVHNQPVLTRIHSQCLTGDTLASLRCDCGEQLHESMKRIQQQGKGIILYLNQEGRGIGLSNKIKAYALQDKGLDTVEANTQLGFAPDMRDYKIAADILQDLGIKKIQLLTNNPDKQNQLTQYGIEIIKRIPIEITPNDINKKYLMTKKNKFGHQLDQV